MKEVNLYLLKIERCSSLPDFVNYWRVFYHYTGNDRYLANINVKAITPNQIKELFHWKNGMTLEGSGGKEKSLQLKIIKRIKTINQYKSAKKIDLEKFNEDFSDVTAVWRIFLLHIIQPKVYPMYDQHVHRTYSFLHGEDWSNINNKMSNKSKLDFYYKKYLPFVKELKFKNPKALDEAFFAFGQYINTRNQKQIFLNLSDENE